MCSVSFHVLLDSDTGRRPHLRGRHEARRVPGDGVSQALTRVGAMRRLTARAGSSWAHPSLWGLQTVMRRTAGCKRHRYLGATHTTCAPSSDAACRCCCWPYVYVTMAVSASRAPSEMKEHSVLEAGRHRGNEKPMWDNTPSGNHPGREAGPPSKRLKVSGLRLLTRTGR